MRYVRQFSLGLPPFFLYFLSCVIAGVQSAGLDVLAKFLLWLPFSFGLFLLFEEVGRGAFFYISLRRQ